MNLYLAFLLTNIINKILAECPLGFTERGEDTMCYDVPKLYTTDSGAPIASQISWLSAGQHGPMLMGDYVLLDDYNRFQTEKIPERRVHATGAGAFGYFEVTCPSFSKYCKASLFKEVGKKTDILVRLSVSSGGTGVCDTGRRGKGMAIKFYTDDGNWDLLGLITPVLAIRDAMLVPSIIHATSPHPKTGLINQTTFWDFFSLRPESVHFLMFQATDRGIPADYRHTNYFPINAYKVVNDCGQPFFVKFTIRTDQGVLTYNNSYAQTICASDYDHSRRDLYNSISAGDYPSWTLCYQIMTPEETEKLDWNAFDPTKVWPHGPYPMHELGRIVLNKNTPNHFAYVEQAAFCPSNMVPGIEPSPDKTLHARLLTYRDAQRYRLGNNHQQLPVNRPKVAVHNTHRDGCMVFDNQDWEPNYYPNSEGYNTCPEAAWSKWSVAGDVARYDTGNENNYDQAKKLWYDVLTDEKRDILVSTLCASLLGVEPRIQERSVSMFCPVSKCLCKRIAAGIAAS